FSRAGAQPRIEYALRQGERRGSDQYRAGAEGRGRAIPRAGAEPGVTMAICKNDEIKFITKHAHVPDEVLRQVAFSDERNVIQEDIYSYSYSGAHYFKLRINDGIPTKLLRYTRLTSPVIRESQYDAYELPDKSSQDAARFIFENIPVAGVVRKRRRQLE